MTFPWPLSDVGISLNITESKPSNMAAGEEKQKQHEAEQQSMETSGGDNGSHDQEKEDKEKRREAKVSLLFTNPASAPVICFCRPFVMSVHPFMKILLTFTWTWGWAD